MMLSTSQPPMSAPDPALDDGEQDRCEGVADQDRLECGLGLLDLGGVAAGARYRRPPVVRKRVATRPGGVRTKHLRDTEGQAPTWLPTSRAGQLASSRQPGPAVRRQDTRSAVSYAQGQDQDQRQDATSLREVRCGSPEDNPVNNPASQPSPNNRGGSVMDGLPVVGAASGHLATFHRNPGPCGRPPPAAPGPPALPSPPSSRRLQAANRPGQRQSGYSSLRQLRGSAGCAFGVRSSRKLK